MIFKQLDFHIAPVGWNEEDPPRQGQFHIAMNHIIDSFTLRIPKKIKTSKIRKLNVTANKQRVSDNNFSECEGIFCVELEIPDIKSIFFMKQADAAVRVKEYLQTGIDIACGEDFLFAEHRNLWHELLATSGQEFDYDLGISRSHKTRRWRCDAVLRIAPDNYYYDLLVRESASQETIQRHRIKTTICQLPLFVGIGFAKLRWDKQDIIGLTNSDVEVFRFATGLSP